MLDAVIVCLQDQVKGTMYIYLASKFVYHTPEKLKKQNKNKTNKTN